MQFYIGDRCSGKTTDMVKWMTLHPKAICVTINELEVRRLEKTYPLLKGRVITFDQRSSLRGRRVAIAIDNLDLLLQSLFSSQVEYVTATGELVER